LAQQIISRPASGNQTSASFDNLKTGNLTLTAVAYPNADATGIAQAQGTTPVTIQSGQTASVSLTMASTIDHLEVSPSTPSLKVGQTTQLTAKAKDSAENVVLVSARKLRWQTSSTASATVDTTGKVTAVSTGNPTITVTEMESGKAKILQIAV